MLMDIFVQIEIISRCECHRAYSIVLVTGNESGLGRFVALWMHCSPMQKPFGMQSMGKARMGSNGINRQHLEGSLIVAVRKGT